MTTEQTRLLANFVPMLSLSAVKLGEQVVILDRRANHGRHKAVADGTLIAA